jgi:hypothetical protein
VQSAIRPCGCPTPGVSTYTYRCGCSLPARRSSPDWRCDPDCGPLVQGTDARPPDRRCGGSSGSLGRRCSPIEHSMCPVIHYPR